MALIGFRLGYEIDLDGVKHDFSNLVLDFKLKRVVLCDFLGIEIVLQVSIEIFDSLEENFGLLGQILSCKLDLFEFDETVLHDDYLELVLPFNEVQIHFSRYVILLPCSLGHFGG